MTLKKATVIFLTFHAALAGAVQAKPSPVQALKNTIFKHSAHAPDP